MPDPDQNSVHADSLADMQDDDLLSQQQQKRQKRQASPTRPAGNVDPAMDAIIGVDQDFRIESFNHAAEQMFGRTAAATIGLPIEHLIPARHRSSLRQRIQFLRKTGLANRSMNSLGLLRGVRADDSEFPIEVSIFSATIGDTGVITAIVRDVSEWPHAEQAARARNGGLQRRVAQRTAQLKEALQSLHHSQTELTRSEAKTTLNTLAASVAHELLTPISNGMLAADTLSGLIRTVRQATDNGSIKRSDFIAMLGTAESCCALIERNLQRAEDLLTSFRQVAADQASEQLRSFDLAATLGDVVNTLAPTLKRHPHRVVVDIPSGIAMHSRPGPLGQVAINLINNAYLHAFENRTDGVLAINADVEGEHLTLHFVDNGVGIPPEHLDKLYDAFFSTKIGKGGTGLGMAIVKNLVTDALGGRIDVQSTLGQGTRFDIRLPLCLPAAEPVIAKADR